MFSLNRCPLDRHPMDFFGISSKRTEIAATDTKGKVISDKHGNVQRVSTHHRWTVCSHCGNYFSHDDNGRTVETRKGFTKSEIDSLFPTTRESDRG